jgi:glyoxylase-like metal-dependent hydrolase (beta-lactamase superfamily II)
MPVWVLDGRGEMAVEQGTAVAIGEGLWLLDLHFLDVPNVVAAYLMAGNGELALIETGPSSTLPALRAGIRAAGFAPEELTALLVTHIHLDHAGAAGVLVGECPRATVYVHPIGAPHMVDPSRLLSSATRIYGDEMDRLWGEVRPIPAERIVALEDEQSVSVAGRVLTPLFTPGHASHHVVYWEAASGTAYTGDVGGIRIPGTSYVCPPTPPPDLDPAAWAVSAARLQSLGARRLCLTHFGPFDDAEPHLAALIPELEVFVDLARTALQHGADQSELTGVIHDRMSERLGAAPDLTERQIELATPSYMAALGLTRYLTKRGEVPSR